MYSSKGFSLIELMIVVAIIGVLAMIAMPFYKNYVIKVRITEAISTFATPLQLDFAEAYAATGVCVPEDKFAFGNYTYFTVVNNNPTNVKKAKFSNINDIVDVVNVAAYGKGYYSGLVLNPQVKSSCAITIFFNKNFVPSRMGSARQGMGDEGVYIDLRMANYDGSIGWECTSNIDQEYLPRGCYSMY